MNTLNSLKTHFSKLFSTFLVVGLLAGCAAVTDANLDSAETSIDLPATDNGEAIEDRIESTDSIWFNTNGDDMDPIIDRPKSGGQEF